MANFNYRVAWHPDYGYFGQFRTGDKWHALKMPARSSDVEARLDCKLAAARAREECRLDPVVRDPSEGMEV